MNSESIATRHICEAAVKVRLQWPQTPRSNGNNSQGKTPSHSTNVAAERRRMHPWVPPPLFDKDLTFHYMPNQHGLSYAPQ